MKRVVALALLVCLSGCYCAPQKGDSEVGSDTMGYIAGCWAYAKGQDK